MARLLQFMELGERLASNCAAAQATLTPDRALHRFLVGQAHQEAAHALAFKAAVAWLAPRHLGSSPCLDPLERYRRRIERAIARRDFAETLLAEQIIMEGLGEAILGRIEAGMVKRGAGFARLRRMFLKQEEAHHAFGHRVLERLVSLGVTSPEALRARVPEYLALIDDMIEGAGDLLESIDENPADYLPDPNQLLPHWLREGGQLSGVSAQRPQVTAEGSDRASSPKP